MSTTPLLYTQISGHPSQTFRIEHNRGGMEICKAFKMLPLLLLCHVAMTIGAPTVQCDPKKVAIKDGTFSVSEDKSTVQYNCSKGMYPHPGPSRECTRRGTWTNEKEKAECKAIECPKPQSFEGGEYYPVKKKYFIGDILTFECWGGYKLVGPENRTCQENGKWSGRTTICDDNQGHCPNPGIPIGTTKVGSLYRIEDRVTYQCQNGLQMFGSNKRQCQEDHTWSGAEPSCRSWYTYDTPEEVSRDLASVLAETIESANPNNDEKGDRMLRLTEGGPMNIFIVIDASQSVGEDNFNIAKEIAKTLIAKISLYNMKPRYSIITYGSESKIMISIEDEKNTDPDEIMNRIDEFPYSEHEDKQGTNTRGALLTVNQQISLFKERNKDKFYETSTIIFLMTDGKYNMGGNPAEEIKRIRSILDIGKHNEREDKLDVYVFGVGDDVEIEELNGIASQKDKEQHVFKMESIEALKTAFDSIIDETKVFEMCGISKDHSMDVKEKYPWIVKVTIARPGPLENCKGSIITPNFILTAAHCFHVNEPLHYISVETGATKGLKAKNLYFHPKYDAVGKKDKNIEKSFDYDLALIELEKMLEYSVSVRPICLPCTIGASWALKVIDKQPTCKDHKNILLPETEEIVSSLFITETSKDVYEEMIVDIKQGEMRKNCLTDVEKVETFKNVADIKDVVTDSFFCTGGTQHRLEPQTCKGDSGGPLIIQHNRRYIQVGVISWGTIDSCTNYRRKQVPKGSRDFHASVLDGMDWISKISPEEVKLIP